MKDKRRKRGNERSWGGGGGGTINVCTMEWVLLYTLLNNAVVIRMNSVLSRIINQYPKGILKGDKATLRCKCKNFQFDCGVLYFKTVKEGNKEL